MQPQRNARQPQFARTGAQRQAEPTVVTGGGRALSSALVQARQSGQLKLRGRGLTALPPEVLDISSVALPEGADERLCFSPTCVAAMGSAGWRQEVRQAGQLLSRSITRGAHVSQYSAWPHAKRTERGAS